jgi:hypothetical protein
MYPVESKMASGSHCGVSAFAISIGMSETWKNSSSRSKNGVASLAYVASNHVLNLHQIKSWMPGTRPAMMN